MKVHCCLGSYYDVPCTQDCPTKHAAADATAWAAYSRAWPQAMAGMREFFITGSSLGRRELVQHRVFGLRRGPVEYTPQVGLDWSEP